MRTEGGVFVKSPWYYRSGTRPTGATPYIYYDGGSIGAGFNRTVRASATPTSTLGIYLGTFSSAYLAGGVGTNSLVWIGLTITGLPIPFAANYDYNGATTGMRGQTMLHVGMAMWDDAYSIEISHYDQRAGATHQGKAALQLEYYGK